MTNANAINRLTKKNFTQQNKIDLKQKFQYLFKKIIQNDDCFRQISDERRKNVFRLALKFYK